MTLTRRSREMKLLSNKSIGRLRRFLFVPWDSRWNALVRDLTAKLG